MHGVGGLCDPPLFWRLHWGQGSCPARDLVYGFIISFVLLFISGHVPIYFRERCHLIVDGPS